ncbi:MAG TPA: XRE family transcriptional regulator [Firmicutes bacterium]|nr:XRE family transcriptional regulator [Bacillota bacterium]
MKEIKMAHVITQKRKEKQLTQDDLAQYMGVSKAAISKWETGQSYPDITLLPILASYFNMSIDELMGYEPQMPHDEIMKLYKRLCTDFEILPFQSVILECERLIKKYYSCAPLLHQLGILYINHSMLASSVEETNQLNQQAKQLFVRVKQQTEDVELAKQALHLECYCCLLLNQAEEALELLGESNYPKTSPDVFKATAYQMLGRLDEAKSSIQIGFFQHLMEMFQSYSMLLTLNFSDKEKFTTVIHSMMELEQVFNIRTLNPYILMPHYLIIAQGYVQLNEEEMALDYIERYVECVKENLFPMHLKGNEFFDLIDPWLEKYDIGVAPRSETIIKQSIIESVTKNKALVSLQSHDRYVQLIKKLNYYL